MSLNKRSRQQGVVLIIALLVLVAMSLAAVGMVRMVDSTSQVAGNLSFRRDVTSQADFAVSIAAKAADTIMSDATGGAETTDAPPYYANAIAKDDRGIPLLLANALAPSSPGAATGTAGVGEQAVPLTADGGGLVIRWVYERACPTGTVVTAAVTCKTFTPPGATSRSIGVSEITPPDTPYVVATVRVDGPKNQISYVQALVR
jgi:type IV pilus assembly protein PilX